MTTSPYNVLIRPIITEDSMTGSTLPQPQYVFEVAPKANKIEIARAVEEAFNVNVTSVNTLRQTGKVKRLRGPAGRRRSYKKAFVTLEPGNTIDLF